MKKPLLLIPIAFLLLIGLLIWHPWREPLAAVAPETVDAPTEAKPAELPPEIYHFKTASKGGSGKFYMDREISTVMGHEGINWLERDSRENEEAPSQAVLALDLSPDAVVADIGSGSGYYSFRIAKLVPDGQVIGVDIQPEMLTFLEQRAGELEVDNVRPHLGKIDDIQLDPESIDAALMVDAYHEFSHPHEMMESIVSALRPGGRVFLIEYRAEDPSVPIKALHKMSQLQARKEMETHGLEWETTHNMLPWQHLMVFRKPQ